MEQRITVDSILDKKFSTVAKGFNQQEVDEYLDQICDEFDRRDAEMNTLRQEIAQLKAAQANGSNTVPQQTRPEAATDDSFREILEMAKRVKDQTIADAQTKASQILANAENEARQQLSDLTKQKERAVEELRVSVRELVEFTLHGADIRLISGRMQDMLDGTLGHQARQKLLGDGWQAEVPLNLPILVEDEELTLVLGGRMDAFRDAPDVPCVEEIKLWQGEHPPEAPIPAHRMQAVCYGHMLCETRGLPAVDVRVVYVTRRGKVQGEFPERLTAEE